MSSVESGRSFQQAGVLPGAQIQFLQISPKIRRPAQLRHLLEESVVGDLIEMDVQQRPSPCEAWQNFRCFVTVELPASEQVWAQPPVDTHCCVWIAFIAESHPPAKDTAKEKDVNAMWQLLGERKGTDMQKKKPRAHTSKSNNGRRMRTVRVRPQQENNESPDTLHH